MIRRDLHGQTAFRLATAILRGDYPPESLLPREPDLMVMYGVSRTVMREALRTLTSKGLVESRPKIGTRVRPRGVWNLLDADLLDWYARVAPPIAFALKLQEMREMVEPYAAALAARMHTPETFDAIDGAARAMAAARNVDEWVRADLRFHLSVLEAGGNELLVPLGTLIDRTLEAQLHLNARRAMAALLAVTRARIEMS
ncbi:GntR family transcriptional regulator [Burkholderia sp. HI2714]|uniref:FadR/GntR family transcriptional regulator n=1 Tax=Burkholderia sp. HI2714 TaxID=2015359 RepID=UPI000B7AA6E9|nr:GntR family transcriptional regulator [Burkholderia sp. HI2714]OXJ34183.1 GntR family transcriptional regulator [Burkholderia sp. HI2714]